MLKLYEYSKKTNRNIILIKPNLFKGFGFFRWRSSHQASLNQSTPDSALGKHPRRLLHMRRHLAQVVQAVAECHFHLRQSLETMADDIFIGHAYATVQLHRFLTDMAGGPTHLQFGA